MLQELPNVKQVKGQRRRRWFWSEDEDLIVWYAWHGAIFGFQLCYDKRGTERALTWLSKDGFSHDRVDDGEDVGVGYKRAPVLVPDGVFDASAMSRRFLAISEMLPREIVEFVSSKLRQYTDGPPKT